MRLINFCFLFIIMAITIALPLDIKINNLTAVTNVQMAYRQRLENAIDDAIFSLVEVDDSKQVVIHKEESIKSFYQSLYSNFGILHDYNQQNRMKIYLPLIIITQLDGFYLQYQDAVKTDNGHEIQSLWTSKIKYLLQEDGYEYEFYLGAAYDYLGVTHIESGQKEEGKRWDLLEAFPLNELLMDEDLFERKRRNTIITTLKDAMEKTIKEHNLLADSLGITYEFTLPVIPKEDWYRTIDDIGFLTIFQGYPYGIGTGDTFSRHAFVGARTRKGRVFYLQEDDGLWYHRGNCSLLTIRDNYYSTQKECAKEGAYPCLTCLP